MSQHVVRAARLARVAFLVLVLAPVFELSQAVCFTPPPHSTARLAAGALFVACVLLAAAAGEFVPVKTRDGAPKSDHSDTVDDLST